MELNETILSAKDIHRTFKTAQDKVTVLNGVNLDVKRMETVSITGASGVGKSTLLHILGGLDRPTEGAVSVNGTKLTGQSETALAHFRNENIGFVFQFHYLMEDFSALENVMMPMLIAGRKRSDATNQGELLLEKVGLIDRSHHRPAQLSGGEQQRVAVARALANEPKLVLADEPSGNLDTATGQKLHDLLLTLNQSDGITFIIATHNMELARQCRRRLRLADGQVQETF